jgi:gamma-glutamyltranspeptidase/glutathione hydrolase
VGGNAVAAAITASAILCITEPRVTGIGGDCFAPVEKPDGSIMGLNGSGRSAKAATSDLLKQSGLTEIASRRIHAVTVLGAMDAGDKLMRSHGGMTLGTTLGPVIRHAEAPTPVTPRVGYDWAKNMRAFPVSS